LSTLVARIGPMMSPSSASKRIVKSSSIVGQDQSSGSFGCRVLTIPCHFFLGPCGSGSGSGGGGAGTGTFRPDDGGYNGATLSPLPVLKWSSDRS
jgi:hypothetical protein